MTKVWNQDDYRELLEDIACEYCEPKRYCIFKEFLISSHPSPRLLMQLKAIDKFKFEKGKELSRKVDWSEALDMWVAEGYAKRFAEVYDDDLSFSSIYKKVRGGNGNGKK